MKTLITLKATIMLDGTITVGPIDPRDFESVRNAIMSIMIEIAGDNPIAESDCIDPADADEIARRLAKMILGEQAA